MSETKDIRSRLDQLERQRTEDQLTIWKTLHDLRTDLGVLEEVVQAIAAQIPNLNPVMEHLLARKDELLAQMSPLGATGYAAALERWHTALLYIQRVEKTPGA